ncbi:MAG TPA: GGDEF domain-containing protein [Thermoanaerobaculia bacterium]|nr:GGDEF domain-containing protein [Thermoanaerobaculia bacterium]
MSIGDGRERPGSLRKEVEAAEAILQRRTRLRTRILVFSIAYGAVLVLGAFLLTWRSRESQKELGEIVHRDLRATAELDRIVRVQNAWRSRWQELADSAPSELPELAGRYDEVRVLLGSETIRAVDVGSLHQLVASFGTLARQAAEQHSGASQAERAAIDRRIEALSSEISRAGLDSIRRLRRGADERLGVLENDADGLMLTALGVTWMIAILTLALARMALVKIVEPVERLSRAATAIANEPEGGGRVAISGDREVALLARDFNVMIDAIAARDAELARLAATDELTSMANFRTFQREMEKEIERSARYTHAFGLLIFDLDHFKMYNDRYGHLAGNEALRAVARTIHAGLRTSDLPARYGGEEFAAIVPEIDLDGLTGLAERIRAAIAAIPPIGDRDPLTCSIGGAMFPDDGRDPESLFAAADRRLYQAKELGRNRTVTGLTPAGGLANARPA